MHWIPLAILAYFVFALVFALDKYILSRPVRSPLSYAFYSGILGGSVIFLIPFFDFKILEFPDILLSFFAGIFFVWALVYFYRTLQASDASVAVPFIGALMPVATLIFSVTLGIESIQLQDFAAFAFLVAGSLAISFGKDHKRFWQYENIVSALGASLLFGLSFALTKEVFYRTNFISGLVWTRLGGVLFALFLLNKKSWRDEILSTASASGKEAIFFVAVSKLMASAALILQIYAISIGSVVIVNSLQATEYAFLLILTLALARRFPRAFKKITNWQEIKKRVFAVILIAIGLAILAVPAAKPKPIVFGVTFSQKFAEELNFDWKKNYLAILDDLKVKELRLVAYWDKVEPASPLASQGGHEENKFDFADLDWQITEAQKRGARVILAIGKKTPRWPECHEPEWVSSRGKDADEISRRGRAPSEQSERGRVKEISDAAFREDALLNYIKTTVERYRKNPTIWAWQVENEPLFPFGECGMVSPSLLNKEIALVKSLDNPAAGGAARPIILTDAGEMGFAWPYLAVRSDIFGTTLYRYVHNRVLGDIQYSLIPPAFFRLKAWLARVLEKDAVIVELQAEPWSQVSLSQTLFEDQARTMNPEIFKEIIDYAEISGFPKAYLWGAEWWYWMREKHDMPEMWEVAKQQIQNK